MELEKRTLYQMYPFVGGNRTTKKLTKVGKKKKSCLIFLVKGIPSEVGVC